MATAPVRPMSTGELLDRTFTLFRRHFGLFVGIMILPQVFALAQTMIQLATPSLAGLEDSLSLTVASGIMIIVMSLAFFVTSLLAQAATIFAISEIQVGRATSIRQAYRRVRNRLWSLIISGLVFTAALVGGIVLLLIPGIWLLLRGALVFQVTAMENLKGRAALRRSIALTKGSAGQIFLVWIFIFLISIAALAIFQFPAAMLLPAPWSEMVGAMGGVIAGTLAGPIAAIGFSLVYFDQRVRKEALDLQLMLAALDQPVPAPGSIPPPVPL